MIIKGGPAGNTAFWSTHLLRDDTNDSVRVLEMRGLMAENLKDALREMQAIARQSRSRGNFMYQANINPPADEHLTEAQWKESVDRLEKNLRLDGHQRVVVEHVKGGRRHVHVIWNRVDVETLKVVDVSGNYAVHTKTARELEELFGLRPVPSSPKEKAGSGETLWERQADERSGHGRDKVTEDLTRIWGATKTGREFRAALEKDGYILAKGDRRDFCVVDAAGTVHGLARRLIGVTAAEVRLRLKDIDRDRLPSVAEARMGLRESGASASSGPGRTSAPPRAGLRQASSHTGRGRASGAPISGSPALSFVQAGRALSRPGLAFGGAQLALTRSMAVSAPSRPAPVAPVRPVSSLPTRRLASFSIAEEGPMRPGAARPPAAAAASPDGSAGGRAEAAYHAEFARWQAQIDAVFSDRSLTPDQRAVALNTLRTRQQIEANGARKRILDEEQQRARAALRAARAKLKSPEGPKI